MYIDEYSDESGFQFDKNGSVTKNMSSGIYYCRNNILNLPDSILFRHDGNTTNMQYLADGRRIRSVHKTYGMGLAYMLDNLQAFNDPAYTNEEVREGDLRINDGKLSQLDVPGGVVKLQDDNGKYSLKPYYFLTDYLGSIRGSVNALTGEIVESKEYMPSGILFRETYSENQSRGFCGKEKLMMHGFNVYDSDARLQYGKYPGFMSMDPLCQNSYSISPYVYCGNNPVNAIDPDGRSTWVMANSDGTYQVIGGDLEDNDLSIYVYSIQDGQLVRGESIGESDLMTSFYNSDGGKKGEGGWSIGSIIDPNDHSGIDFFNGFNNEEPSVTNYMANATKGGKYDFKQVGVTKYKGNDKSVYFYRGMPIGKRDGKTVYSSARDIGNYTAGYIAGHLGIPWWLAKREFDKLELKENNNPNGEGRSTVNAERHGWKNGVINSLNHPWKTTRWRAKSIPGGVIWLMK